MIEYGPFDKGEDSVLVPGAYNPFPYLKQDLFSVPQPGLNNAVEFIPVGSVVGGGSTVNAMFFIRCTSEDYDSVKNFGNPGWGFSDLLPYFKKVRFPLQGLGQPSLTSFRARTSLRRMPLLRRRIISLSSPLYMARRVQFMPVTHPLTTLVAV